MLALSVAAIILQLSEYATSGNKFVIKKNNTARIVAILHQYFEFAKGDNTV